MCSPSAPPPPDYTGAAAATSAGNLQAARATATANRVDQYTPEGSIVYTNPDPSKPDKWTMTQSLSPAQQVIFDQNQRVNQQLGNISEQGVGYVQDALGSPLSTEGMYDPGDPGQVQAAASDAAYANATKYLDSQMARNQSALDIKLANQGITQGSEAYHNAYDEFNQNKDTQYANARNQAYLQGLQGASQEWNQGTGLRQNQITEAQLLQQNPINMLNAVRTGQQMEVAKLPQQMATAQQQGVTGADMLGATQAAGTYNQGLYNAQVAQNSNTQDGLFDLGGAAIRKWG